MTISFNQAEYLARNRVSIEGQDGGIETEHIIVDPGSTDGSRDLIAGWARGTATVVPVLQPDSGPADGLNRGLAHVTGDVWLYLNADDELAPHALRQISEYHRRHPHVDVLVAGGWTVDSTGSPVSRIHSDRFSPARYAMSVGTVLQQGTSFKTNRTLPDIQFNAENRLNWDTEYLFDLHRAGRTFGYWDVPVGYFRLQPASITMSGNYEAALSKERARLRSSVPLHRAFSIASPAARMIKAIGSRAKRREAFPGLVSGK